MLPNSLMVYVFGVTTGRVSGSALDPNDTVRVPTVVPSLYVNVPLGPNLGT